MNTIRIIVTGVVLAIWTVIGFFLWIPFLTRMIAYFSGVVAASAFASMDVQEAQNRLNLAIEFYIRGFRKVIGISRRVDSQEIELKNTDPIDIWNCLTVAANIVWTLIFWTATLVLWARIF